MRRLMFSAASAALVASERNVGRGGGLAGPALRKDVAGGRWRTPRYETNRNALQPPNRNWSSLEELVRAVRG
jgi:hypothetical protein